MFLTVFTNLYGLVQGQRGTRQDLGTHTESWWWWPFSSLERIWGEGLTIHSFPACAFFFFESGDQLAHTNSTFFFFLGRGQSTMAQRVETTVPLFSR